MDILEKLKPALIAHHVEAAETKRAAAAKLRELSEAQARANYERTLEREKSEAARTARMKDIQLMEAQRAYENMQALRQQAAQTPSDDGALEYLNLIQPAASSALTEAPAGPCAPLHPAAFHPIPLHPAHSPPAPSLYSHLPTTPTLAPPVEAKPRIKYRSENGLALREVLIPSRIIGDFLKISASNTRKNIETCGLLVGKLAHNVLTLTHLIIPKQEGTSDTCEMIDDDAVLMLQLELDVYSLGWIHTHPTQQCFLSSVDLHTQHGQQALMMEAIAIVVAPTQSPNFGVFRVTDPPGMGVLLECDRKGFHPHRSDLGPLFKDIGTSANHAQFRDNLPLEIIDLR